MKSKKKYIYPFRHPNIHPKQKSNLLAICHICYNNLKHTSQEKETETVKKETQSVTVLHTIPLAIFMSSAVLIRAMSVELKCTVLSSATGRSMRSSLCGKPVRDERMRKGCVPAELWCA